jgi:hypothetical protein
VQHEEHNDGNNQLAEIWRHAQLRRAEDIYRFFIRVFRKPHVLRTQRPLKPADAGVPPSPGRIASVMSEFLDVTRTG